MSYHKEFSKDYERALRLLAEHLPREGKKPVLLHSIAVGMCLYHAGYARQIVLGGFLHDVVEDAPDVTREMIAREFGEDVAQIVSANTKNSDLASGAERRVDIIARCAEAGEDALIVKAADILENFAYYERTGNAAEITGHCVPFVQALLGAVMSDDVIFDALQQKLDKHAVS